MTTEERWKRISEYFDTDFKCFFYKEILDKSFKNKLYCKRCGRLYDLTEYLEVYENFNL